MPKTEYVLLSRLYRYDQITSDGYYTGHRYRFSGEPYACVDPDISKAKRYKSRKVAEKAAAKMNVSLANYEFDVVPFETDRKVLPNSIDSVIINQSFHVKEMPSCPTNAKSRLSKNK